MSRSSRVRGLTTLVPVLLAALHGAPAWAQSRAADCVVEGDALMSASTDVYDRATGGKAVARFTGGSLRLVASEFPRTAGGRARASTGGFRIDGFVAASAIPVYTSRSVPVSPGHVWIAPHRRIEVVSGAGSHLRVQKKVGYPIDQIFETMAPCDALTLTAGNPPGWSPAGDARGYAVKKAVVELFDTPRGAAVTRLRRAPDAAGVLLWSTVQEGSWVRVEYHGDIIFDAWARLADVEALPPGETMDQLMSPAIERSAPRIRVQGEPQVVKPQATAVLRSSASDAGSVIGRIDAGTEIYVLDVVAGWASVLPKTLSVSPAGDGQFWARAKDLGI